MKRHPLAPCGRGQKIDLSYAKTRFSGEGLKNKEHVINKAILRFAQNDDAPEESLCKVYNKAILRHFVPQNDCNIPFLKEDSAEQNLSVNDFARGMAEMGADYNKQVLQSEGTLNLENIFNFPLSIFNSISTRLNPPSVKGGLKKAAFTLAEVLITLLIIGIIAAMTLPALYHNYEKTVLTARLKKSYAMLTQGFAQMKADNNTDWLGYTDAFRAIDGGYCYYNDTSTKSCEDFYRNLRKYFNIIGTEKALREYNRSELSGTNRTLKNDRRNPLNIIAFKDGSLLLEYKFDSEPWPIHSIYTYERVDNRTERTVYASCDEVKSSTGGTMCDSAGDFYLDVNGLKGPNIIGRDIFHFYLSGDGRLIPYGSKDASIYDVGDTSKTWQEDPELCGHQGKADADKISTGEGCAARIMDNGWVMDY